MQLNSFNSFSRYTCFFLRFDDGVFSYWMEWTFYSYQQVSICCTYVIPSDYKSTYLTVNKYYIKVYSTIRHNPEFDRDFNKWRFLIKNELLFFKLLQGWRIFLQRNHFLLQVYRIFFKEIISVIKFAVSFFKEIILVIKFAVSFFKEIISVIKFTVSCFKEIILVVTEIDFPLLAKFFLSRFCILKTGFHFFTLLSHNFIAPEKHQTKKSLI